MNPLGIRMTRLGSTTWVENCIEVTREKLTSDFKALVDNVQELLKTTSNQTGESIADLRRCPGAKAEEGRRALSEQERILRGKAEAARASAEAYLREKPWATLGIAAGIGLMLGFLMRRRDCARDPRRS